MNKLYRYIASPRRSTRDLSVNTLITVLLAVVFTLINPNFISNYNLVSIGQNLAPYAILSLGVLFPISMGGIDLSIGTTCVGSAVVAGKLFEIGMPLWCVIPVMLVFGALIGLLNGAIIAKYNIQPFIVTLGTMMFVRGITAIFAGEPSVLYPADCWYNHLFSNFKGFPMGVVWVVLFAAVVYLIFRKTKYGRYFISIGSNEKATRISGVNITKYKCIGYAFSGLMAGMAGIFWSASFATVTVATGNGMELDAVAAIYIGGTSALGGMANVWGGIIGSVMLVLIRSGLNFALARLDVSINSTYVTYVISGMIVAITVMIERMREGDFSTRKVKGKANETKTVVTKCISVALSAIMLVFLFLVWNNTISLSGFNSKSSQKTICVLLKSEDPDFWNSVTAGANAAGKVKVITEVKPSASDNAYKAGLEYLYEKGARLIYGTCSYVSHQIIDAIQASSGKYDGMKFAAYDTSEKINEWMNMDIKAELIGAVDQNPYMIGKYTVETLIKLSQGEPVEEEVLVPGIWCTKDNVD